MTNNRIKKIVKEAILKLINNTICEAKVKKIISKHEVKTHFVPIRYRVFGGLLQSLNIQFGNFIEVLLQGIVEEEKKFKIISELSGKKNIILSLSQKTDASIDYFISDRQNNNDNNLTEKFGLLSKNIIENQQSNENLLSTKHDVDVLFLDKNNGIYYYLEVKYNDDHDTDKFAGINRKFLKTYAGLIKKLEIKNVQQLKPILYYFNRKVMKGNIYIPEETNIYRGEKLFDEFFNLKYDDLDEYLKNVSEDKETIKIFDQLYKKIRFGEIFVEKLIEK